MNRTVALTAVLLAAAASLAGCSTIKDVVDVAGPIVEAVNEEDTWLELGDCFNETTEVVSDVPTVDCATPHDYEVYAAFEIDLTEFPGDDEVFRLADEGCLAPFATYVGVPFESSSLDYSYYVPTADGWNNYDDREVTCILFDPAGEMTGSMIASGR